MEKSRSEKNIELTRDALEVANEKATVLVTEIGELRDRSRTKEDYEKLAELYQQIEELYESKKELESSFQEQYKSQVEVLKKAGILQELKSGQLGVKGIDGKEYPLPAEQDVAKRIEANKELVERKQEQGFTKLLIVPFGMKLDDLIEAYKQRILDHSQKGKLFATKKEEDDKTEHRAPLALDKDQPVWVWDEYEGADVNGKLVYRPKQFSKKHQGKTKQEILKEEGGWQIMFVEDMPNIPREGKGETAKGRKQFEANDTPNEYLKTLNNAETKKTDPHNGEKGMTPEEQIIYAITHLEETDEVVDDWQGNGSVSYQIGAYFPSSGYVPSAYWDRDYRQAYLGGSNPDFRDDDYGVRPAVRI